MLSPAAARRRPSLSDVPTPARSLLTLAGGPASPSSPIVRAPLSPTVKTPTAAPATSPSSPSAPISPFVTTPVVKMELGTPQRPACGSSPRTGSPSPMVRETAAALLLLSRYDAVGDDGADKENDPPAPLGIREPLPRADSRPTTDPMLLRELMAFIERWKGERGATLRLSDEDYGRFMDAAIDFSEEVLGAFKRSRRECEIALQTSLLKALYGPAWHPPPVRPPTPPPARPLREIQGPAARFRSARRPAPPPSAPPSKAPGARAPAAAPQPPQAHVKRAARVPGAAALVAAALPALHAEAEVAAHLPPPDFYVGFDERFAALRAFMAAARAMPRPAPADPHEADLAAWAARVVDVQRWGLLPAAIYARFKEVEQLGWRWAAVPPRLRELLAARRAAAETARAKAEACRAALLARQGDARAKAGKRSREPPSWFPRAGPERDALGWGWKRIKPTLWVLA